MEKHETAQQLRKVANFVKGLVQAADDLERIGSLESAITAAGNAHNLAISERDKAQAELANVRKKMKKVVEDASAQAAAEVDAAGKRAQAILSEAKDEADRNAEAIKAAAADAARAVIAEAHAEDERLKVEIDKNEKEFADLAEMVKKARAEHEDLAKKNADLADAIKTVREKLGG